MNLARIAATVHRGVSVHSFKDPWGFNFELDILHWSDPAFQKRLDAFRKESGGGLGIDMEEIQLRMTLAPLMAEEDDDTVVGGKKKAKKLTKKERKKRETQARKAVAQEVLDDVLANVRKAASEASDEKKAEVEKKFALLIASLVKGWRSKNPHLFRDAEGYLLPTPENVYNELLKPTRVYFLDDTAVDPPDGADDLDDAALLETHGLVRRDAVLAQFVDNKGVEIAPEYVTADLYDCDNVQVEALGYAWNVDIVQDADGAVVEDRPLDDDDLKAMGMHPVPYHGLVHDAVLAWIQASAKEADEKYRRGTEALAKN
jgi:hypothetical protein